ncbi:chemokine-like protein TAFA-5 isoform 1-T1 [Ciconia maguari]
MQLLKALWALAGAAICCFLIFVIHSQFLKEGQLAAGTCEIVTLDRDSSQPRRTIARQTARCACKKGQIAGTTRARPACVDDFLDDLGQVDLDASPLTSDDCTSANRTSANHPELPLFIGEEWALLDLVHLNCFRQPLLDEMNVWSCTGYIPSPSLHCPSGK